MIRGTFWPGSGRKIFPPLKPYSQKIPEGPSPARPERLDPHVRPEAEERGPWSRPA
ncbi:hypothetical protein [Streptomyces sp. NPDC021224]|uniref:hypothetical protein n=1 Tax=unclassified Streptomyces TaxID=2593676 RepID=UPI003792591C